MEQLLAAVLAQGWGYSVDQFRPRSTPVAYIHTADRAWVGEGDTPAEALANAYQLATRAQLKKCGLRFADAADDMSRAIAAAASKPAGAPGGLAKARAH